MGVPRLRVVMDCVRDTKPTEGEGRMGGRLTGIGTYHDWEDKDEIAFIASPGKERRGARIHRDGLRGEGESVVTGWKAQGLGGQGKKW